MCIHHRPKDSDHGLIQQTPKSRYLTRSLHRIFQDDNTARIGGRVAAWARILLQVIPSPGPWNRCLLGSNPGLPLRRTTSTTPETAKQKPPVCRTAQHHLVNPPTCHYSFTKSPAIYLSPSHRLLLRAPALEVCGGACSLSRRVGQDWPQLVIQGRVIILSPVSAWDRWWYRRCDLARKPHSGHSSRVVDVELSQHNTVHTTLVSPSDP